MNLIAQETARAAGIQIRYVPFAGAGPSGAAVLGGHVDYRVCLVAEALPNIRAGKTRGLAISYPNRIPELPEVPTFKELGIAFVDFPLTLSYDLWGPLKLPQSIQDTLAKALQKGIRDADYVQFCKKISYFPVYKDAKALQADIKLFDEKVGTKLAAFYKK
jgi:tripartite-type tricarboxylate transporter receptor subunit TctC